MILNYFIVRKMAKTNNTDRRPYGLIEATKQEYKIQ